MLGHTEHDFLFEQGLVKIGETAYRVKKQGPWSGRWSLQGGGKSAATAQKGNPFTRSFEIRSEGKRYSLKPINPVRREFKLCIEGGTREVGRIVPQHAFTRRAIIAMSYNEVPVEIQVFAFWLVVLMWRRAAGGNANVTVGS